MKIQSCKKQKHGYLIYTVVDLELQSLHGGSLEITLSGPLTTISIKFTK